MKKFIKRVISMFPISWQQEIRRLRFAYQIKRDIFETKLKECDFLEQLISKGDYVIDVGANIGHYTAKMSKLVGSQGQVFAFEPISETFDILSSNVNHLPHKNVTLINAAASNRIGFAEMRVPKFDTGLPNYYMAQIDESGGELKVYCLCINSLGLPNKIKLIKIDAEGHDYEVLLGMIDLIKRDRPVIIAEDKSKKVIDFLERFGYRMANIPESENVIFNFQK